MVQLQFDKEQVLSALDKLLGIKRKPRPKEHKLKWKLPEARVTVPLKDAEEVVGKLEKKIKARFVGGGEYADVVHAKEFGEGVFAYILVRTDKKTEEETIAAETYMIQEEEKLGFDVTTAYKIMEDLQALGYEQALEREYTIWRFQHFEIPAVVYSINGFGDFLELALPATNFVHQRERTEKKAFALLEKLGFNKQDAIPTDVITLQVASAMQAQRRK